MATITIDETYAAKTQEEIDAILQAVKHTYENLIRQGHLKLDDDE